MQYAASIDNTTGCAVVYDTVSGDVALIVPDGKMQVVRRAEECEQCKRGALEVARKTADALNRIASSQSTELRRCLTR